MSISQIGGPASKEIELGCEVRDLVTKFQGIVIAKITIENIAKGTEISWVVEHQTGKGNSKIPSQDFFDGRLERVGDGICHSIRALKARRT